jgi:hypothetical protein
LNYSHIFGAQTLLPEISETPPPTRGW